jgi:hypothetical protein
MLQGGLMRNRSAIFVLATLAVAAAAAGASLLRPEYDANQPGPGLDAGVTYYTLDDSSLW